MAKTKACSLETDIAHSGPKKRNDGPRDDVAENHGVARKIEIGPLGWTKDRAEMWDEGAPLLSVGKARRGLLFKFGWAGWNLTTFRNLLKGGSRARIRMSACPTERERYEIGDQPWRAPAGPILAKRGRIVRCAAEIG